MPDGMSMSPEVQAYSQESPGPEHTEQLFKQRFTDMAFKLLFSKFSEMAPNVVTFKILEVDPDAGSGIGVFIVLHEQKSIYIPVVLTDSRLKPMEMFYYKELNIFLPLSLPWLDEISKMALDEMGEGADLPKEVPQDVNIRNLVVPPITTTGRVGYASDEAQQEHDAKLLFKEALHQSLEIHPQFLNVLRKAPKVVLDGVKLAFTQHPGMLQKIATCYGRDTLIEAVQEGYRNADALEKTAAAQIVSLGTVEVLTKTAGQDEIIKVFGERAGAAFSEILKQGFAVNDTRPHVEKIALNVESTKILESPGPEAGWYKLYFLDGKPDVYYVIPFPKSSGSRMMYISESRPNLRHPVEYLVVSKDGKEVWTCDDVMGQKIHNLAEEGIKGSKINKLLNRNKGGGDSPKVKSYGFFMNMGTKGVQATKPFQIDQVVTDGGVKKITTGYHSTTYVIDNDPSRKNFDFAMDKRLVFVPNSAKYIEMLQLTGTDEDPGWYRQVRDYERKQKTSVIKDPQLLLRWMNRIIETAGGERPIVKKAGRNLWWVGNNADTLSVGPALQKVASIFKLSADDAAGILIDAQRRGNTTAYILDRKALGNIKTAFTKLAQPPGGMEPAPPPQSPGMEQGMAPPPGMEQGMAPPPMPAISPTDLAIGEAIQGLQQQNEMSTQQNQSQMEQMQQQMEMQQQSNEQLVQVLTGIQQRSAQISQASGGQIPEGAEQSPAVAAQAIAPMPAQEEEAPPMPMMDQEGISPEMVAEQINPDMVDQAASFQDDGMFDTAAIAMLAAAPVLQDIVSAYVPNMEKAIDNLGRVLLTLWIKEKETKEAIGDEEFISLEEKLRTVFKNMGDVVLSLSHNAMSAQSEAENAQRTMQSGK